MKYLYTFCLFSRLKMTVLLLGIVLFCQQMSLAQGSWTTLAPSVTPRVESQSAVVNGKMYVFAGFTNSWQTTRVTEVYDPAINQWKTLAPMPKSITHQGSVVINGESVWFIGGFETYYPGSSVLIYNTVTNAWSTGPSLPVKRGSMGTVRLGRKIHIFGGLLADRATETDEHYVLDLDNQQLGWTKAAPLPIPRNHLSGAVVGGKIYAIGGQKGHGGNSPVTYLKVCHVYDPTTDTWSAIADLPTVRSHYEPGTIVYDGKILIVGGRTSVWLNNITEYDVATDTWKELAPLPEGILAPNAKVFGNLLLIANGYSSKGFLTTTRSRQIERTGVDKLVFLPEQLKLSLEAGKVVNKTIYLSTFNESASYTINTSNLPSWLKVSPATGTTDPAATGINIQVDASGLASGTYTTTLTASAPGYANVSLPVQVEVSGQQSSLALTGFTLINADTDQDIKNIANGEVIDYSVIGTKNINIRANTSPATVGSVIFNFDGTLKTENVAPYALGGDVSGSNPTNYNAFPLTLGSHMLKATPYSARSGGGTAGTALTVNFTVVEGLSVLSLTLINADTDQDIRELKNGEVIDYSKIGTKNINIRANTNPATTGSVIFNLNGTLKTENMAPYALGGDVSGSNPVNYNAYPLATGSYTLKATPYSARSGGGTQGMALTISFTVATGATARTAFSDSEENNPLTAYPNPSASIIIIEFNPKSSERVTLDIMDGKGVLIRRLYEGLSERGKVVKVELDCSRLNSGIYLAKLVAGNKVSYKKLVIEK